MAEKQFSLKKVAIRQVEEVPFYSDSPINRPSDVVRILADEMSQYDRESVMVVNLNTKGKPISFSVCSIGSVNEAMFIPRDILKSAILSNASSILLAHNHPSHDPTPSKDDIICTDRLQQVCSMLGISIVDHVIIGDRNHYFSFKEKNIMPVARCNFATSMEDIHLGKVAERKENVHEKLERNKSKVKQTGEKKPVRKRGKEQC